MTINYIKLIHVNASCIMSLAQIVYSIKDDPILITEVWIVCDEFHYTTMVWRVLNNRNCVFVYMTLGCLCTPKDFDYSSRFASIHFTKIYSSEMVCLEQKRFDDNIWEPEKPYITRYVVPLLSSLPLYFSNWKQWKFRVDTIKLFKQRIGSFQQSDIHVGRKVSL